MWSRKEIYQAVFQKIGQKQIAHSKGELIRAQQLEQDAKDLLADLDRLRDTPESNDFIEELHLRFLARCRLLSLGEYCIEGFIGAGQCGVVYHARHASDATKRVAVKLLIFPRNEEEQFRFVQEGDILYELNHPTIVRGIVPTQKMDFIPIQWFAMELVENARPFENIASNLSMKNILKILSGVCNGLAHAHDKNIYHRDLNMNNILVLQDMRPKILDFGAAKYQDEAFTFRPVGALRGCSPEKLNNPNNVDGKTDVFAIGCIIYNLETSKWPFYGETFGELVKKLSACDFEPLPSDDIGLSDCIVDTLKLDPADRPDAEALAARLLEISAKCKS